MRITCYASMALLLAIRYWACIKARTISFRSVLFHRQQNERATFFKKVECTSNDCMCDRTMQVVIRKSSMPRLTTAMRNQSPYEEQRLLSQPLLKALRIISSFNEFKLANDDMHDSICIHLSYGSVPNGGSTCGQLTTQTSSPSAQLKFVHSDLKFGSHMIYVPSRKLLRLLSACLFYDDAL
ncbi:uncharacterized protein V1518DRAFT_252829 [Limtongia smithiae]|uniref:uncharacterized protein n=1 Tax=Limtongia smithiae TaxID=1125753 RepID=UPI0034CD1614